MHILVNSTGNGKRPIVNTTRSSALGRRKYLIRTILLTMHGQYSYNIRNTHSILYTNSRNVFSLMNSNGAGYVGTIRLCRNNKVIIPSYVT
jgi:hypothetical protein